MSIVNNENKEYIPEISGVLDYPVHSFLYKINNSYNIAPEAYRLRYGWASNNFETSYDLKDQLTGDWPRPNNIIESSSSDYDLKCQYLSSSYANGTGNSYIDFDGEIMFGIFRVYFKYGFKQDNGVSFGSVNLWLRNSIENLGGYYPYILRDDSNGFDAIVTRYITPNGKTFYNLTVTPLVIEEAYNGEISVKCHSASYNPGYGDFWVPYQDPIKRSMDTASTYNSFYMNKIPGWYQGYAIVKTPKES